MRAKRLTCYVKGLAERGRQDEKESRYDIQLHIDKHSWLKQSDCTLMPRSKGARDIR